LALAFFAHVVVNVVIVYVEDWLLSRGGGDLDVGTTVFFMCLISLITTLHDRYRPVLATRVIAEREAAARQAWPRPSKAASSSEISNLRWSTAMNAAVTRCTFLGSGSSSISYSRVGVTCQLNP
jgi:hypothetical protein